MPRGPLPTVAALFVALALVLIGCSKATRSTTGLPNQAPTVTFGASSVVPFGEAHRHALSWTGHDPDGVVRHYLVAHDPKNVDVIDESWVVQREATRVLTTRSRRAAPMTLTGQTPERDFEVIAVRAVDDRGLAGPPSWRAVFGDSIAPTVQITSPPPSEFLAAQVPSTVTVRFEGNDPDGHPDRPASYRWTLIEGMEAILVYMTEPDSLRRQHAPSFEGWHEVSGRTSEIVLEGLSAYESYLFALVAIDEDGLYTPVFSLSSNLLFMNVLHPTATAPRIEVFSESFHYIQPAGGGLSAQPDLTIEQVAPSSLVLNWFAVSVLHEDEVAFRWGLDVPIEALLSDDRNSWNSGWSTTNTSARITLDEGRVEPLIVTIQAVGSSGIRTTLRIEFRPVQMGGKDLLIVDDTRFIGDQRVSGTVDSMRAPSGAWPNAAELDTFLFARGGFRWRSTASPQILSPAGIFNGYSFDTLGTRANTEDRTVPLATLAGYRHVVWLLDGLSSTYGPENNTPSTIFPETALRYMSKFGRVNTLAAYISAGGRAWTLGGGVGNATLTTYNRNQNDEGGVRTYSSVGTGAELIPGRFMYDVVGWRSEFKVARVTSEMERASVGGTARWNGIGLPPRLESRSPATDPLPPYRSASSFYTTNVDVEWISEPNDVHSDRGGNPAHGPQDAALDTVYVSDAVSPILPDGAPTMTYAYGLSTGDVVFSGFSIWSWKREQCVQLVDAVLQGLWGLSRQAPVAGNTWRRE